MSKTPHLTLHPKPLPNLSSNQRRLHLHRPLLPQPEPDFLTRLESRQPYVRTPVAPESIPQRAVPAAAHLPLHGEVDFGIVHVVCRKHGGFSRDTVGSSGRSVTVGLRRQGFEVRVCLSPAGFVFGFESLRQAAGAVFAGAAALAWSGGALGRCRGSSVSQDPLGRGEGVMRRRLRDAEFGVE